MVIGIVAAMEHEFELIIDALENKKTTNICGIDFYEGKINDNYVVGAIGGIGKVNAAITTTLLINNYHPNLVINSGIAGGTIGLHTNDIVIASELEYSDVDVEAFGYPFGQIPGMPLKFESDPKYKEILKNTFDSLSIQYKENKVLTADTFRLSAKEIKNKDYLGSAVEMEGASIAQTCYKLQTPFLSIRFISDILDTDNHMEDYNSFEKEAAYLSSQITIKFIKAL